MKNQHRSHRSLLFLVPRLLLWSICMLYVVVTVVVTFDKSGTFLYPLEYLRSQKTNGK